MRFLKKFKYVQIHNLCTKNRDHNILIFAPKNTFQYRVSTIIYREWNNQRNNMLYFADYLYTINKILQKHQIILKLIVHISRNFIKSAKN